MPLSLFRHDKSCMKLSRIEACDAIPAYATLTRTCTPPEMIGSCCGCRHANFWQLSAQQMLAFVIRQVGIPLLCLVV